MEERKTRRNKRILIVSAMLVLLLALLCFGGVTFAKYVTNKDVTTDQATVAKWGYVITADASKLYGEAYAKDDADGKSKVKTVTADDSSVNILSANKVVAPGATGELTITIKGEAEVSSKITIKKDTSVTVQEVSLKYGDGETDVYNPIKWTLKKGNDVIGTAGDTLENCLDALATTATNRAGTKIDDKYTLSWEWAFDDTATVANADIYDTVLGDAAAMTDAEFEAKYGEASDASTTYKKANANTIINFKLIVTVEQVQDNVAATPGA